MHDPLAIDITFQALLLLSLSPELIFQIVDCAYPSTILTLALTCSSFHHLAPSSARKPLLLGDQQLHYSRDTPETGLANWEDRLFYSKHLLLASEYIPGGCVFDVSLKHIGQIVQCKATRMTICSFPLSTIHYLSTITEPSSSPRRRNPGRRPASPNLGGVGCSGYYDLQEENGDYDLEVQGPGNGHGF
ncbi:hypothetical protein SNK05_002336 [Fusarium graminearum]